MSATAFVDGAFTPLAEARVSVLDRGYLFGDGVYEVTAVLDGRLVDADAHLERLARSLAEIGMAMPLPSARLLALHEELVARAGLREGLVYLQVTREGGPARDFLPPPEAGSRLVMFTDARPLRDNPWAERGIAVATVPDLRWARRDIKSVGLLAQVLAKREAAQRGCQDAWLVADDGRVTEGASATAFIVSRGVVVTRPNGPAILPGVTRRALLALAEEHRLALREDAFTVAEAHTATEAFQTSATSFVLPVVGIDGVPVGDGRPGPVARRLRALYVEAARADATDRARAAE